jgi:hypothetical protein
LHWKKTLKAQPSHMWYVSLLSPFCISDRTAFTSYSLSSQLVVVIIVAFYPFSSIQVRQ